MVDDRCLAVMVGLIFWISVIIIQMDSDPEQEDLLQQNDLDLEESMKFCDSTKSGSKETVEVVPPSLGMYMIASFENVGWKTANTV